MEQVLKPQVTIVTHNSKFHTDDIFAVATLLLVLEKEYSVTVIRSRDKEIINAADYVVDVGDEYHPERNRFDHHQEGRAGERENGIPYASFGLVWKKYGVTLCGNEYVSDQIDKKLIQPTDASDNGIKIFSSTIDGVHPYTLDSLRRAFVPSWKEGFKNIDDVFLELVTSAKKLIKREIIKNKDELEAKESVERAYVESSDKRLVIFDTYYPSEDFIVAFPEPLFIVFPSSVDGTWLLQTIQNDSESRINRKDLPETWAGKSDTDLENITGVPGSIFCHINRFLAVAKTKEAILALAHIALNS